eukprot:COSAG02_NODE_1624_length_11594_cov_6.314833_3_plen_201_part_00
MYRSAGPNWRIQVNSSEYMYLTGNFAAKGKRRYSAESADACTVHNTSHYSRRRRIAFSFPPALYETDLHMLKFLDEVARILQPCEMDWLNSPAGMITSGATTGYRPVPDSRAAVSSPTYRVRAAVPGSVSSVAWGPVTRVLNMASNATHSCLPTAFAAARICRSGQSSTKERLRAILMNPEPYFSENDFPVKSPDPSFTI